MINSLLNMLLPQYFVSKNRTIAGLITIGVFLAITVLIILVWYFLTKKGEKDKLSRKVISNLYSVVGSDIANESIKEFNKMTGKSTSTTRKHYRFTTTTFNKATFWVIFGLTVSSVLLFVASYVFFVKDTNLMNIMYHGIYFESLFEISRISFPLTIGGIFHLGLLAAMFVMIILTIIWCSVYARDRKGRDIALVISLSIMSLFCIDIAQTFALTMDGKHNRTIHYVLNELIKGNFAIENIFLLLSFIFAIVSIIYSFLILFIMFFECSMDLKEVTINKKRMLRERKKARKAARKEKEKLAKEAEEAKKEKAKKDLKAKKEAKKVAKEKAKKEAKKAKKANKKAAKKAKKANKKAAKKAKKAAKKAKKVAKEKAKRASKKRK